MLHRVIFVNNPKRCEIPRILSNGYTENDQIKGYFHFELMTIAEHDEGNKDEDNSKDVGLSDIQKAKVIH